MSLSHSSVEFVVGFGGIPTCFIGRVSEKGSSCYDFVVVVIVVVVVATAAAAKTIEFGVGFCFGAEYGFGYGGSEKGVRYQTNLAIFLLSLSLSTSFVNCFVKQSGQLHCQQEWIGKHTYTYTVKLLERSCCLFNSGRYSGHTFASRSRRQSSVFRSSNHMVISLAPSR
ncbi:hypothetical protein LWI28_010537 [Acer negundo]|uniref:Uncharacterized protein n=1 Tax=Acer negundo TaxID=4023 RepID=A0AAD5P5P5_ACENE|nr:hypothetical protein LWI28_010537 [Acer negundo]